QVHLTDVNQHIDSLQAGQRDDDVEAQVGQVKRIKEGKIQAVGIHPGDDLFHGLCCSTINFNDWCIQLPHSFGSRPTPLCIEVRNVDLREGCSDFTAFLPRSNNATVNPIPSLPDLAPTWSAEEIDERGAPFSITDVLCSGCAGDVDVPAKVVMLLFGPAAHLLSRHPVVTFDQLSH